MGSDRQFVRFVCEQLGGAGQISSRRMFGEAAIYLDEKVVGLVFGNQFFLKATEAGRAKIGAPTEAAPFQGAKNWFLMADLDDPEFLADLVRSTAAALPNAKLSVKKKTRLKSKRSAKKANGRRT
jgi:TfoX/Sxy family transcriptional regulator of competence genes